MKTPQEFLTIKYNIKQTPESKLSIFDFGANCQLFAYTLLAHFGYKIPPFRSSNLWEDEEYTISVDSFQPLDLMLYHHKNEAWGAHVGLYIGDGDVLHLSAKNGCPVVQSHKSFALQKHYQYFIGAKRLKSMNSNISK